MKRFISILCLLVLVVGAKASEPTTDRVYATGLQYDSDFELYCFEVILEGNNYYTAYGLDIQLPEGMEVIDDGETIYVLMNDPMYPQNKLTKKFSHSVTPAFPYPDDHSHLRVGCLSTKNEDMVDTSGTLFRAYIDYSYKSLSWPLGTIKVYAVELNKVGAPFDAPDQETIVLLHSGETALPLNISSTAQWSTCILPFSAAIPEGVKAYTTEKNDEQYIYLKEAESLEAYTPYILYSETGYSGNISGTVAASGYPETGCVKSGYLCGAIVPQTVTEGYVLQKQTEGVKFYAIAEGDSFNIPAGKCWMQLSEDALAKFLGFKIEDTDGISTTVVPASKIGFDISGRQAVSHKGLLIKDGKKTLNP